jgi:hypothetical protein
MYRVRIYCHTSFERGSCDHDPPHPFVLPDSFDSILTANDAGGSFVAQINDDEDEVEWEVIDSSGNLVC